MTSIFPSGRFGGRCKFVNMRFVRLWHVCVEVNKETETVPCDSVFEGIFVSAVSEEYFDSSTFLLLFKKRIILNPLMKAPHIRPNNVH
jgi:hypothetical protein